MLWETTNAANLLQEVPISSVKIVLLTGCTGTVGPYVLHQLSRLPQIQSIYCLVRSHQVSSGRGEKIRIQLISFTYIYCNSNAVMDMFLRSSTLPPKGTEPLINL